MFYKNQIKFYLRRFPRLIENIKTFFGKDSDLNIFYNILKKGDIFFDIGSNTGQYTIPLAHYLGRNGSVHSFEPVKRSFKVLKHNILFEKPLAKVFLNNVALGNYDGETTMNIPGNDFTQASIMKHEGHSWNNYDVKTNEKVKISKLDTYIYDNNISNIAFIKCDVEGAELNVMKGAKNLLSLKSPPILKLEIYDQWTKTFNYEPRDLIRYLEDIAGYQAFYISPKGLLKVSSRDKIIPGIFWKWLDFLFVSPDMLYKIKSLNHNKHINS